MIRYCIKKLEISLVAKYKFAFQNFRNHVLASYEYEEHEIVTVHKEIIVRDTYNILSKEVDDKIYDSGNYNASEHSSPTLKNINEIFSQNKGEAKAYIIEPISSDEKMNESPIHSRFDSQVANIKMDDNLISSPNEFESENIKENAANIDSELENKEKIEEILRKKTEILKKLFIKASIR